MGSYQSYFSPRISIGSLYVIMNSDEESSEEDLKKKCVICFLEDPEYVITTCWHKCLCLKCGQTLTSCPICRTEFNPSIEFKKIFES